MGIYETLGLRPVINASATLTKLGGSILAPPALAAMADAAGSYVDLSELQRVVSERIAALTHNEACYVSSGAAAGIMLSIAACIAETDPERMDAFPYLDGIGKREVIIHRSQRNGYDYAARQTGARLVEIDGHSDALDGVISDATACVLWFAGAHFADGALPIEDVIEISHARGVPVIVDAAAQVPPIASLWHFTRDLGADAAIFSGGKGLRGPQSSGLVLGTHVIIAGCRANGAPNYGIGRPMKVGKEELVGLLAAVEWSLAQDEPTMLARYEAIVQGWLTGLRNIPGITVERGYPSEAGQPHARAIVRIAPPCPLSRDAVIDALWERNPRIAVAPINTDAIALNPQPLLDGENEMVLEAVRDVVMDVG